MQSLVQRLANPTRFMELSGLLLPWISGLAAVLLLSQKHYGCVGVIDDEGRLAGIVTDGDIARNLSRNLAELNVDDIMTRAPKTVKPTTLATAALGLLNQHNISALIVTDETVRPVGIVHFHDLLRIGVA